jgi:hypothetical protein
MFTWGKPRTEFLPDVRRRMTSQSSPRDQTPREVRRIPALLPPLSSAKQRVWSSHTQLEPHSDHGQLERPLLSERSGLSYWNHTLITVNLRAHYCPTVRTQLTGTTLRSRSTWGLTTVRKVSAQLTGTTFWSRSTWRPTIVRTVNAELTGITLRSRSTWGPTVVRTVSAELTGTTFRSRSTWGPTIVRTVSAELIGTTLRSRSTWGPTIVLKVSAQLTGNTVRSQSNWGPNIVCKVRSAHSQLEPHSDSGQLHGPLLSVWSAHS